jgi:uncharacterized Zn-binding protein involved in type VI secretion
MPQKTIIRIGDRTSHGGTVLEGHPLVTSLGKLVSGVGHRVSCPRCGGNPVIAEGTNFVTMFGVRVAVDGMKTSCGAILIGSAQAQTAES